jgi:hypothetical protein
MMDEDQKKYCANGHAHTRENLGQRPDGRRYCKLCRHERVKRWWQRKDGAPVAPRVNDEGQIVDGTGGTKHGDDGHR